MKYQHFLYALFAGAIASAAMPASTLSSLLPNDFSIVGTGVGLFGLAMLLWQVVTLPNTMHTNGHTTGNRLICLHAFFIGLSFGSSFFLINLYWIAQAPEIYNPAFAPLGPVGAILLSICLAMFFAIAAVAPILLITRTSIKSIPNTKNTPDTLSIKITRLCVLIVSLTLADWSRGHFASGFPWHLWGHAMHPFPTIGQIASLVGIYGASAFTLFITGVAVVIFIIIRDQYNPRRLIIPITSGFLIIATIVMWGKHRIDTTELPTFNSGFRIIQPNIDQRIKWDQNHIANNFKTHLLLQSQPQQPDTPNIDFIIWPETAAAFNLIQYKAAINAIASALPNQQSLALVGTYFKQANTPSHNSMLVINAKGSIQARYDKFHLVPFGEYTPLIGLIPILAGSEYTPGTGLKTIKIKADSNYLPSFSTLICYEIIFPNNVALPNENRPDFLINITNDAWFTKGKGPEQHLEMARWRAIEEGLMLIRSANTGISAVIDPLGRIKNQLSFNQRGIIDGVIIKPLAPTFYSIYGDIPLLFILLLFVMSIIVSTSNIKAILFKK